MNKAFIEIKESSMEEVLNVHKKIPEFRANPPQSLEEFLKEVENKTTLILLCYLNGNPAGYSVGYDKFKDGSFYSWLGGILPEYRRHGLYRKLRSYQEEWARNKGYKSIRVKTWNRRIEMRIALASLGYNIINLEIKPNVLDNRLMHEKLLI